MLRCGQTQAVKFYKEGIQKLVLNRDKCLQNGDNLYRIVVSSLICFNLWNGVCSQWSRNKFIYIYIYIFITSLKSNVLKEVKERNKFK